jgi:hypothetical protein
MKKGSDFDHEIKNLVEKNVGTLAILSRNRSVVQGGPSQLWFKVRILIKERKQKKNG